MKIIDNDYGHHAQYTDIVGNYVLVYKNWKNELEQLGKIREYKVIHQEKEIIFGDVLINKIKNIITKCRDVHLEEFEKWFSAYADY